MAVAGRAGSNPQVQPSGALGGWGSQHRLGPRSGHPEQLPWPAHGLRDQVLHNTPRWPQSDPTKPHRQDLHCQACPTGCLLSRIRFAPRPLRPAPVTLPAGRRQAAHARRFCLDGKFVSEDSLQEVLCNTPMPGCGLSRTGVRRGVGDHAAARHLSLSRRDRLGISTEDTPNWKASRSCRYTVGVPSVA